ncbi:hypothetical protein H9650_14245 [Psychrobacillus sp. Sa2BUA9]|uniref:DUF4352 domain-containing protein n=1 Tax=Psychrobacillus faecigallinarum TaxID=2762235 RepID=A0ABR8RBX9_9BACI|nr:hypothetical protein [Psychrobacillus faecigallinarum]MBD7945283.1 hypothetical protein [Psychrobacillus faecigallinarum]
MKEKLKNKEVLIAIALSVVIVFGIIVFVILDAKSTQTSYETAVLNDSNVTIDSLEITDNKQTFNILIENTSNESLSVYHTFRIESGGNTYKSELSLPKDFDINPNMSTTIKVDFKMPASALDEDNAKLIISNLSFSQDQVIHLN